MDTLDDVIAYFYLHSKCRVCLSTIRISNLIYLSDWKSYLTYRESITGIPWTYGDNGPESDEIFEAILTFRNNNPFCVIDPAVMRTVDESKICKYFLSDKVEKILEHIRDYTNKRFNYGDLSGLVNATYPMLSRPRGVILDMANIVEEYIEFAKRREHTTGKKHWLVRQEEERALAKRSVYL